MGHIMDNKEQPTTRWWNPETGKPVLGEMYFTLTTHDTPEGAVLPEFNVDIKHWSDSEEDELRFKTGAVFSTATLKAGMIRSMFNK